MQIIGSYTSMKKLVPLSGAFFFIKTQYDCNSKIVIVLFFFFCLTLKLNDKAKISVAY